MSNDKMLERKLNILKIRVNNLVEEHADVLANAQELHEQLSAAHQRIQELEAQLTGETNVQAEEPRVHVITDKD